MAGATVETASEDTKDAVQLRSSSGDSSAASDSWDRCCRECGLADASISRESIDDGSGPCDQAAARARRRRWRGIVPTVRRRTRSAGEDGERAMSTARRCRAERMRSATSCRRERERDQERRSGERVRTPTSGLGSSSDGTARAPSKQGCANSRSRSEQDRRRSGCRDTGMAVDRTR